MTVDGSDACRRRIRSGSRHATRSRAAQLRRWLTRVLPGVMLLVTFADDAIFGGLIIGAQLAFGSTGLVTASALFVVLSVAMAAASAWALHREPLQLSDRSRRRIDSLLGRRFGRFLMPHPGRPLLTALGAVVFGSVAPIVVAALDPEQTRGSIRRLVLPSGIAYGLAFAAGYGLFGALVGVAV